VAYCAETSITTLTILCSDVHKLAEGLEPSAFWLILGGHGKHQHFSPVTPPAVSYILPQLYSIRVVRHRVNFVQQPSTKKEDLLSKACLFMAYKDQVEITQTTYMDA